MNFMTLTNGRIVLPEPEVKTETELLDDFAGGQPEQLFTRDLIHTIFARTPAVTERILTPEQFGADPTGTISSDAAFELLAAFTNALAEDDADGRGILINMTGRYKLNDEHIFTASNLMIDGQGRGIIDLSESDAGADADAWATLHFAPPEYDSALANPYTNCFGPRTTITTNVAAGTADVIDVHNSAFTVADPSVLTEGDIIAITSTGEYWNGIEGVGGYNSSNKAELNYVAFIFDDAITPAIALKDSYLAETYTTYVRKVKMISDITIKGLRAIGAGGGALHDATNPTGVRAIDFDFVNRATIIDCFFENFPRFAALSNIGIDHSMVNSHIIGRKLDDSSNYNPTHISQWFTGWVVGGILGVSVTSCTARFCRRLVDPDASQLHVFDDDILQQIPCRDISIIGGKSYSCITGPAGHKYQGLNVVGHEIIMCGTAIQHRGKDLTVTNVDATCEVGLVVGVGNIDAATYTELPSSGFIRMNNCNFECSDTGIHAVVAWDEFKLSDSKFTAPLVCDLNGKSYPNWRVRNTEFTCTNPANPIIRDNYLPKTTIGNWNFKESVFQGGTYAFDILGSSGGVSGDLIWENNKFLDISLRAIRFGSTGVPLWGDRIIVKNNVSDITISGLSNGFGANVLEIGNDWVPLTKTLTIVAGVVTLPDGIPSNCPVHFVLDTGGGAADLNTITGGNREQFITFSSADGGDDVTVKNGVDNIICGADFVLTVPTDAIILMRIANDDWIAISKQDNA